MKVLVIGASSFTGKHFCDYARAKGAEVVETGLRDLKKLSQQLHEPQEYVVNFAALNVVAPSWKYPSDYLFTNVYALTSVIDILKDAKLEKFVQVSTPEVMGSAGLAIKERELSYSPSTPYAVSRAAAEMMLRCYSDQYLFPVAITRACNVYGTGQQLYRLIPKLIMSIKNGMKFPLEGGGKSSRCFLHVHDVCDATWRVMIGGLGEYHISSRELQSIEAIVRHVCVRLGVKFEDAVQVVPERPGKDSAYMLDSGRIRAELDWQDTISFDTGLNEVISWIERDWDKLKDQSLEYHHRP